MTTQDRYWQAKKITLIGAFSNVFLGIIKLFGGILFHSHALIADGLHSFSDLLTDLMVIFASKYGSLDADENHPYGHQRIETAATFLLALLLTLAGGGIAWDAIYELLYETSTQPHWFTIPIAALSILCNELLFHYTKYIAEKIQSPLILANAWHHRSDAAASIVVLIGLIGSILGFIYLDAIAAIIVGFMIIKMGLDYGWNSILELVDTAADPEIITRIEQVISTIQGVHKVHQLRTRSMGGDIYIDVHILVSPRISVSEGHYIAQHTHRALVNNIESVKDVTVHVDSEDDELVCPSLNCPSRDYIENQLLGDLRLEYPDMLFCTIHYLNGKVYVDLIFDQRMVNTESLHNKIQGIFQNEPDICEVRIYSLEETLNNTC